MKLEIKHLSGYLPYGVLCTANDGLFKDHPLSGLFAWNDTGVFDFENGEQDFYFKDLKPSPTTEVKKGEERV